MPENEIAKLRRREINQKWEERARAIYALAKYNLKLFRKTRRLFLAK